MKPRKLRRWELARVDKLILEEIRSRQEYPGTVAKPIGDPADIDAMQAALDILFWHTEQTK